MNHPEIYAVVPAAGIGSRMQADRPKQYLSVAGKTILEHTLDILISHPDIHRVIIAINETDEYFSTLPVSRAEWLTIVAGGHDRATSVQNGLAALPAHSWALVHDAARPCLSHTDISALLRVITDDTHTGGILACPVRDTMKRATQDDSDGLSVSHTECRDNLWHALTPQLFNTGVLRDALEKGIAAGATITDEASAMETQGHRVRLIEGNPANIKITRPADLPLAAFYLSEQSSKQNKG